MIRSSLFIFIALLFSLASCVKTPKKLFVVGSYHPEYEIVSDDNACKMVATKFIDSPIPVVFCGMNADPAEYGLPAKNITGVIEREFWKECVDLMRELVPGVRKSVIMLDSSITAQESAMNIKNAAIPEVKEVYLTNDYNRWKDKILSLQDSAVTIGLFVYSTLSDSAHSQPVGTEEVLLWLLENSKIPEFAIMDFTVRKGAFCGYCESGYAQGKLAAEIAVRILRGESPENIPVAMPPEGKRIINLQRAGQLGITIPEPIRSSAETIE